MDGMPVAVSAVFLSHNRAHYVELAFQSLLDQDYPLEIVVSDDGSHDGAFEIIQKMAASHTGLHRITVLRNGLAKGVVGNFNHAVNQTTGELVILFEDDDHSEPFRARELVETFVAHERRVAALWSPMHIIDERGQFVQTVDWSKSEASYGDEFITCMHGCTLAFRRDVFARLGPVTRNLFGADVSIWLRALYISDGGAKKVSRPLMNYRRHSSNVSRGLGLNYSSPDALRTACRFWWRHQIGMLVECGKISHYLKQQDSRDDRLRVLERYRAHLHRLARLVYVVAHKRRLQWPMAALTVLPDRRLRHIAVRVLICAVSPRAFRFGRTIMRRLRARGVTV
jgi:glycosyltransferase involved in cell wall biosynthesis